jgi:hypothetical protein
MTTQNSQTLNLPTVANWATDNTSDDPVEGKSIRFLSDVGYVIGREKTELPAGKRFAVYDSAEGWRRLEAGAKPEWVMRKRGQDTPPQPYVPESEYVTDLSGNKVNPWRYVRYLKMVDMDTGVISTFETDSTGGAMSIDELSSQVAGMCRLRRGTCVPVVELKVIPFKTRFGMRRRPEFSIVGWKIAESEQQSAIADGRDANVYDDSIPF